MTSLVGVEDNCASEKQPLLQNNSSSSARRYSDLHRRHVDSFIQNSQEPENSGSCHHEEQRRRQQQYPQSDSYLSGQSECPTASQERELPNTAACVWNQHSTYLEREEHWRHGDSDYFFATSTEAVLSPVTTPSTDITSKTDVTPNIDVNPNIRSTDVDTPVNDGTTANIDVIPNPETTMSIVTARESGSTTDMDRISNLRTTANKQTAPDIRTTTRTTTTQVSRTTTNVDTSPNIETIPPTGTILGQGISPNLETTPNIETSQKTDTSRNMGTPPNIVPVPIANISPPDVGSREGKKRMALITLITVLVSCAGKIHDPLLTQYTYQVYTDIVYGNESQGVQISRQPCINDSANSSAGEIDPRNKEVQDRSADLLMNLELVSGGISILINLLLGTNSDVLGRRFLLLMNFLGHFVRNATACAIIYWDLGLPALYAGYVVDGFCGGSAGIFLGLYVYTADITNSDQQRTLAMAVVDSSIGLSTALTNLGAGYFIEDTGFFYPSLVSSLLLLACVLVVVFWLPETVPRDRKRCMSPVEGARRVVGVFLFPGEKHQRLLVLLGLLAFFLALMPDLSNSKLVTLYLMDHPFCWSSVQIGIFFCIKDAGNRLASLLFIQLLRARVLTPVLALLATVSMVGGDVLMALARTDVMVYLVALVSIAGGMMFPSVRSMMSRLVPSDQQGALFAGIAVVESVCFGLSQFCFLSVYRATVSILAGLVYLVTAGCHLLVIVCLLIYLCLLRKVPPPNKVQPISIQEEEPPVS